MSAPIFTYLPVLLVFIPIILGMLIFLVQKEGVRIFLALLASLIGFGGLSWMWPTISKGLVLATRPIFLAPEIFLYFRVDALGLLFALVSALLWIFTVIFTVKYMEKESFKGRFWGFLTLAVASGIGVTLAGNLITLFFFFEMLTVFTYPLVIHGETGAAMAAGRKYFLYLFVGEALLLFSVVFTIFLGGTVFDKVGMLPTTQSPNLLRFLLFTFVLGFGVKAAIFPLHRWLPEAAIAPTPVTALLHADAVVNVGIFGLIRVIYNVFGPELIQSLGMDGLLIWVATVTMIFGSVIALRQDDLKRRLAYSTVAHISYTLLGAAVLSASGLVGALIHLVSHAFMKVSLFFCAGAIDRGTGKKRVSELGGMGYRQPLVMVAFTVASLGLIGVPPTLGFLSKWYLWMGPLEAQQSIFLGALILSTLLCAFYLLPITYRAFFKHAEGPVERQRTSWFYLLPIFVGAVGGLLLGVFPKPFLILARVVSESFLGG
ncbi:MAG: proton-conducting transporter membrane subunit [Actinomycetota bacterium]|nr:proton-conducting transporter membrane subunit [Actinomycetota bacterium]